MAPTFAVKALPNALRRFPYAAAVFVLPLNFGSIPYGRREASGGGGLSLTSKTKVEMANSKVP